MTFLTHLKSFHKLRVLRLWWQLWELACTGGAIATLFLLFFLHKLFEHKCIWVFSARKKDPTSTTTLSIGATVISVLPGSRLQEVTRMLTIFANTMELLQESFPELVTAIHVAPNQHVESYIDGVVSKWPVPAILIPGGSQHPKYDTLSVRYNTLEWLIFFFSFFSLD